MDSHITRYPLGHCLVESVCSRHNRKETWVHSTWIPINNRLITEKTPIFNIQRRYFPVIKLNEYLSIFFSHCVSSIQFVEPLTGTSFEKKKGDIFLCHPLYLETIRTKEKELHVTYFSAIFFAPINM